MFLVGKGRIGGSYCDSFHHINKDGTVGGRYARKMSPSEQKQILIDIQRHRAKLLEELADLDNAQKVMDTNPQVASYDW